MSDDLSLIEAWLGAHGYELFAQFGRVKSFSRPGHAVRVRVADGGRIEVCWPDAREPGEATDDPTLVWLDLHVPK